MTYPNVPTGVFVASPKAYYHSVTRKQISRYSSQVIGLVIQGIVNGEEVSISPDPNSITLTLEGQSDPNTQYPPGNLLLNLTESNGITRNSDGSVTYVLQPDQITGYTFITAQWSYTVQGSLFTYVDYFVVVDPMPTWESLSQTQQLAVEQTNWMIGDLYDSTEGGPHLMEEFQTKFGYERLAQLLLIANQKLNYESIPLTRFVIGTQVGQQLPDRWIGILQWAHYIEVLKHLVRTYTEQPSIEGGPQVAFPNRRDYMQRWQSILQQEEPDFKHAVRMYKRKQLNLGSGAYLVSGGIFGTASGFFRSSYSAQARAARFGPVSWVSTMPNHS
jgi:hypothetical protein